MTRKNCLVSSSCYVAQLLLPYIYIYMYIYNYNLNEVFIALLASMLQKRVFTKPLMVKFCDFFVFYFPSTRKNVSDKIR